MKVIFLDIDGVLNSVQEAIANRGKGGSYDYEGLSRIGVGLLRQLCEVTGAKIVVSSTWRSDGHEAIAGAFAVCGWRDVVFNKTIIGVTPHLPGVRGKEIQHWLEETPSCDSYVIIDDDSDMLDSQQDHFVKTDNTIGFNLYDMVKAMDILGVPDDEEKQEEASGFRKVTQFKINKRAEGEHGYSI